MKELRIMVNQFKETIISKHMVQGQRERVIDDLVKQFKSFSSKLRDKGEVLMALYISIRLMGDQKIFESLLVRNDSFKDIQPSWNLLFTEKNIFKILSKMMTSV
jgi:hypothetical protein